MGEVDELKQKLAELDARVLMHEKLMLRMSVAMCNATDTKLKDFRFRMLGDAGLLAEAMQETDMVRALLVMLEELDQFIEANKAIQQRREKRHAEMNAG